MSKWKRVARRRTTALHRLCATIRMVKRYSEEELLGKRLSDEQKAELLALAEKGDDEIDTSDIPEVQELPSGTVRGGRYAARTVHLTAELHRYVSTIAAQKGISLTDDQRHLDQRDCRVRDGQKIV